MKYINGFDVLRGIFIILIFLSHSVDYPIIVSKSIWGAAGVTGFFILSGFLSNYKYEMHTNIILECLEALFHFLVKFYPLYFFSTIISYLLGDWNWSDLLKALLLSQSFWGSADVATILNGNTWFLSSIMFSYMISPLINRFVNESNNSMIFIFALLCIIIQFSLPFIWADRFYDGYYWVYICPITRAIDFFYGALLSRVVKHKFIQININIGLFVMLVYFGELILADRISFLLVTYNIVWIPITLALIVFFYSFSIECWWIEGISKIGRISFEIFICHRMVLKYIAKANNSFAGYIIAVIVVCTLSMIMHKCHDIKR